MGVCRPSCKGPNTFPFCPPCPPPPAAVWGVSRWLCLSGGCRRSSDQCWGPGDAPRRPKPGWGGRLAQGAQPGAPLAAALQGCSRSWWFPVMAPGKTDPKLGGAYGQCPENTPSPMLCLPCPAPPSPALCHLALLPSPRISPAPCPARIKVLQSLPRSRLPPPPARPADSPPPQCSPGPGPAPRSPPLPAAAQHRPPPAPPDSTSGNTVPPPPAPHFLCFLTVTRKRRQRGRGWRVLRCRGWGCAGSGAGVRSWGLQGMQVDSTEK